MSTPSCQPTDKNNDGFQALSCQLSELESNGAHRLNPTQFYYLRSLLSRAERQRDGVRQQLLARASRGLAALGEDVQQRQQQASTLAASVRQQLPHTCEQLQALVDAGNLQELKRLAANQQKLPSTVANQLRKLQQAAGSSGQQPRESGLNALLHRQEAEAINASAADKPMAENFNAPPQELAAAGHWRESLARHQADQRVSQAIAAGPQDPGPLNPHNLAIQSLATMRKLSPAYLNRFVAYVDTLMTLEQTGNKR